MIDFSNSFVIITKNYISNEEDKEKLLKKAVKESKSNLVGFYQDAFDGNGLYFKISPRLANILLNSNCDDIDIVDGFHLIDEEDNTIEKDMVGGTIEIWTDDIPSYTADEERVMEELDLSDDGDEEDF